MSQILNRIYLYFFFFNYSLLMLSTEKMHNRKVENYILFSGLSEDFKPGRQPLRAISYNAEKLLRRGQGGTRIYGSFCKKDQAVGTSKDDC